MSAADPVREAVFSSVHMCAMSCRFCGHVDTFESFTATPVAGPTPVDVFQCPACKRAVQRNKSVTAWGSFEIDVKEVGGVL